jgi:hypothetical protein
MSVEDRLRQAMATVQAASREQEEQRVLRERHVAEAQARASAGFKQEISAAMRYAEHMDELNRRKKDAGGWATEKTLSEKNQVMGLGRQEDAEPEARPDPRRYGTVPAGTDRGEPAKASVWGPPAPTPPPQPEGTERTPAPRRPGRHARPAEAFDEDDFSQNTWMRD